MRASFAAAAFPCACKVVAQANSMLSNTVEIRIINPPGVANQYPLGRDKDMAPMNQRHHRSQMTLPLQRLGDKPSTCLVNTAGRCIVFALRRGPGPVGSVARALLPSEMPQAKSILCKSRRYREQSQDRVQSPVRLRLSEPRAA